MNKIKLTKEQGQAIVKALIESGEIELHTESDPQSYMLGKLWVKRKMMKMYDFVTGKTRIKQRTRINFTPGKTLKTKIKQR